MRLATNQWWATPRDAAKGFVYVARGVGKLEDRLDTQVDDDSLLRYANAFVNADLFLELEELQRRHAQLQSRYTANAERLDELDVAFARANNILRGVSLAFKLAGAVGFGWIAVALTVSWLGWPTALLAILAGGMYVGIAASIAKVRPQTKWEIWGGVSGMGLALLIGGFIALGIGLFAARGKIPPGKV